MSAAPNQKLKHEQMRALMSGFKGFRGAAGLFTCAHSPGAVGSCVPGGEHASRWRRSVRGVLGCFREVDLSDHLSRGGPGLPPQSCHLTQTQRKAKAIIPPYALERPRRVAGAAECTGRSLPRSSSSESAPAAVSELPVASVGAATKFQCQTAA